MTKLAALLLILGGFGHVFGQQDLDVLSRRYREGEKLRYQMKAVNEGRRYEVQASGVVKRDPDGKYFEEYAWSNLAVNNKAVDLPPASAQFRQVLSLDPEKTPGIPSLAQVHPMLIGPITDMLAFYVDLWLAIRLGTLNRAGDHVYQKRGTPASWADGNYIVLGQDSIDFDLTLTEVNPSEKVATLVVRHVPPQQPQVKLPADWMREPVADMPNNWVNVAKRDGKFVAEVGKETFDVQIKVSLADGKMLSATMENPVEAKQRICADAALTACEDAKPRKILRHIEVSLQP
jgi:hypothetical protein